MGDDDRDVFAVESGAGDIDIQVHRALAWNAQEEVAVLLDATETGGIVDILGGHGFFPVPGQTGGVGDIAVKAEVGVIEYSAEVFGGGTVGIEELAGRSGKHNQFTGVLDDNLVSFLPFVQTLHELFRGVETTEEAAQKV